MTMAHGVEGRYPFLDHRLFEFASALPTGSRLRGSQDKEVLRRWASRILPDQVSRDRKPPSLAPDERSFFLPGPSSWIVNQLTSEALERVGIFSTASVNDFIRRCEAGQTPAPGEIQAMLGVASTQLWYHQFIDTARLIPALPASEASVLLGDSSPSNPQTLLTVPSRADTAV